VVLRLIVLVIFGGFGIFMLCVGASQFAQQRRLLSTAQPVDALIVVSKVNTTTDTSSSSGSGNFRGGTRTTHTPQVEFTYTFQGAEYRSDMIYPTIIGTAYGSFDAAQEEIRAFPADARVKAFVSDSAPGKAFLKPIAGWGPVVFMIVGVVTPIVAWCVGKLV